jgi:threonine synthase
MPVKPRTIAKSLAIGDPADGFYALREARATGGRISAVTEGAVVEGIRLLARTEGVFTETAGGVTIATLERLVRERHIEAGDETVVLLTGTGIKTMEALGETGPTDRIPATVEAVDAMLAEVGV